MFKKIIALGLVAALGGCAIHQTVKPVEGFASKEICIIDNPAVRTGFLDSYKRALADKGYVIRQLPVNSSMIECPILSTYTANWRWDLAMYMSYAEIKIYNNGKPIGEATYDAQHGGGSLSKFINADKKIAELVNQLFPANSGS